MINKAISGFVVPAMVVAALLVTPAAALASVGYGGGTTVTVATAPNPDGTQTGTVAGATTGTETTPVGDVNLNIPAGLQITGPAGWTGDINMPTVTTTTVAPVANSGNNASVVGSIVVGFGDSLLTFNKAVQLVFVGQAGNSIGYSHGAGTFTQITAACADNTQTTNDLLADGTDCKINVSGDLVVWTKHFSTFTTYTQSAIPAPVSSGSSSGGGIYYGAGGGMPNPLPGATTPTATPIVTTTTSNNQGQVLGAAAYNFTKSLTVGSRGADVTALQQFLSDNKFYTGPVTGYFGQLTKTAVITFQKARGIAQVGNVGPLTRAELNKGIIATTPTTTQLASSGLTATQGAAILGLLQSFNADASVIANVKASLGLK